MEMVSEIFLMTLVYFFLCFTPFVDDVLVRYWIGNLVIGSICLFILASLIFLLVPLPGYYLRKKQLELSKKHQIEQRKALMITWKQRADIRRKKKKEKLERQKKLAE